MIDGSCRHPEAYLIGRFGRGVRRAGGESRKQPEIEEEIMNTGIHSDKKEGGVCLDLIYYFLVGPYCFCFVRHNSPI